jgi:hypothetical protein
MTVLEAQVLKDMSWKAVEHAHGMMCGVHQWMIQNYHWDEVHWVIQNYHWGEVHWMIQNYHWGEVHWMIQNYH